MPAHAVTVCLVALISIMGVACSPVGQIGESAGRTASAGSVPVPEAVNLPDGVLGRWYLDRGGLRSTLSLNREGGVAGGTLAPEGGDPSGVPVDVVGFDPTTVEVTFRADEPGGVGWYRLRAQDGIGVGRFAHTVDAQPPEALAFQTQVTAWRAETFDGALVPRVFDIALDGGWRAVVRLDAATGGAGPLVGQLKIYATADGVLNEQLEEDLTVEWWDGTTLVFQRPTGELPSDSTSSSPPVASSPAPRFTGTVTGRLISGTMRWSADAPDAAGVAFHGQRAEVLGHGLGTRDTTWLRDWQSRTRTRLARLIMAGDPAPLTTAVSILGTLTPLPQDAVSADRDDDAGAWPQAYQLLERQWDFLLPNPDGGAPLPRRVHGYLAVPTTPAPAGGYPVAVALNGHAGSALDTFNPQHPMYWYGDSFARRGYVVVAIDVSHRPVADRAALYADFPDGDDPNTGNDSHPAVRDPAFPSDWEEDGERAWDAMRALDDVLGRSDVDRRRITVVGLSMGGEISDWVGALDPRVGAVVSAGSPPDLAVMQLHGNHPCFNWQRAPLREYLDPGDLHALAGDRTVIRETGLADATYSSTSWPYAGAKQVVRRAQPAFDGLGGTLIHYLHGGGHLFQAGDAATGTTAAAGVTTPTVSEPSLFDGPSAEWQVDGQVMPYRPSSLFDVLPR